jgi:hypothetical protein
MKALRSRTVALLLGIFIAAPCVRVLAQQQPADSGAGTAGGAQPQGQEEAPALPQTPQNDRVPVSGVEDYHLSGINLGRNFIVGQVQVNEVYDTNANSAPTTTGAQNDSLTNVQGMLSIQWLSRRIAFNLDYRPGLLVYDRGTFGASVIQGLSVTEKFYLRRWTLLVGDDFTYLPQSPLGLGTFGVGGLASQGIPGVGGGLTNFNPFFVPGQSIQTGGNRISNTIVGQAQYTFGPRSSVHLSGSYGLLHFFDAGFVNPRNMALRSGYDYLITTRQTFTVSYSRSQAYFSSGLPGFSTDSVTVGYRRELPGRMSLTGESGPQFSHFQPGTGGSTTRISYFVRGSFRYKSSRNNLELSYQHRLTEGSGVLLGAQSDLVGARLARLLSRNWTGTVVANFNRNDRLNQNTGAVTNFHFNSWNGGIVVSRTLGLSTQLQFHYDIARQTANFSTCVNNIACGNVYLHQQIGMGLVWNSRPYSID